MSVNPRMRKVADRFGFGRIERESRYRPLWDTDSRRWKSATHGIYQPQVLDAKTIREILSES